MNKKIKPSPFTFMSGASGFLNRFESETPKLNQQIEPALMPDKTIPFLYACASTLSTPSLRHNCIIIKVFPPPTYTMSAPRILSSISFFVGSLCTK